MSKIDNPWHEKLTEKQRRFCEAYSTNGGNALRAAASAGYSKPNQQGSQNLEKLAIQGAIERLRQETTSTAIMTREQRQEMWSDIIRDKTKPDMVRLRASELLGKSQGDFIDRKELSGPKGGPIKSIAIELISADQARRIAHEILESPGR
ncbi:MAG: terminase small subunit [Desulfocapsaceae bacterium]|nr:terminase small subunit [Desulfocapsaceae bacterium]